MTEKLCVIKQARLLYCHIYRPDGICH